MEGRGAVALKFTTRMRGVKCIYGLIGIKR